MIVLGLVNIDRMVTGHCKGHNRVIANSKGPHAAKNHLTLVDHHVAIEISPSDYWLSNTDDDDNDGCN